MPKSKPPYPPEFLRRAQACFTVADDAPAALPDDRVLERV